jgi:hypothetical protein
MTISDDGCGFECEQTSTGNGLGICRTGQKVKRHIRYKIYINSGTTSQVSFPIPGNMHNCIRVVLIEDDQILLQTYKQLIEAEDDIVVVNGYTSFERAEKCLAMDQPDIILMDIQLPGISGIEAIPLVKNNHPKSTW